MFVCLSVSYFSQSGVCIYTLPSTSEGLILRNLATGTAIFQPPAFRHRLPQKLEAEVSHRLGRAASRPCRRASRVAHLIMNNRIIPMLLVFFLLFLKVVLSDLQFSQGVVFFCWAASILLQYACTSFLSHTHSLGICTHTYTVTRASVTLARTHDPMLLSWQVFVPPFPWLNFPFPCFLSFCYGYFVKKIFPVKKEKKKKKSWETHWQESLKFSLTSLLTISALFKFRKKIMKFFHRDQRLARPAFGLDSVQDTHWTMSQTLRSLLRFHTLNGR